MSAETHAIRDIIDPEHRLPAVQLEPRVGAEELGVHYITLDGQNVGIAHLRDHSNSADDAHISWINVEQDSRKNGVGMAVYLAAIERAHERGEVFRTHHLRQTGDAAKIWQRFIDAGIAEVVEPFEPTHFDDDHKPTHYKGHMRIPPTSDAKK